MAMLWRPETPSQEKYAPDGCWRAFRRRWARPAIIQARQQPRTPKAIMLVRKGLDADRQNRRPRGHPKNVYNGDFDVHIFQRPSGNSAAAALRRLERYRPDILDRVLAGEISAHAGMVEAGFRKPPPRPGSPVDSRCLAGGTKTAGDQPALPGPSCRWLTDGVAHPCRRAHDAQRISHNGKQGGRTHSQPVVTPGLPHPGRQEDRQGRKSK
jgi:hypothetical protein